MNEYFPKQTYSQSFFRLEGFEVGRSHTPSCVLVLKGTTNIVMNGAKPELTLLNLSTQPARKYPTRFFGETFTNR